MPAFHCPPYPSKYMYYMHYQHLNSLLGAAQKNIMDCSQAAPPLQFRHDKPKGYQVSLQRRGVGDLKHSQEMKLAKRETLLEASFQQALSGRSRWPAAWEACTTSSWQRDNKYFQHICLANRRHHVAQLRHLALTSHDLLGFLRQPFSCALTKG